MTQKLEIGFLGLGRMGLGMVKRMLESKKVDVLAWNRSEEPRIEAEKLGARQFPGIRELIVELSSERKIVWLMLPAGQVTENVFEEVLKGLDKGDIIIDGANSYIENTLQHAQRAKKKGIHFFDVGVSGGTLPTTHKQGYPMMVGGDKEIYEKYLEPILKTFGREGSFGLMGPAGTGHYVKMVHNAIEYGQMQAIAEGMDLLKNGRFKGEIDVLNVAKKWQKGTIVEGLLMEMTLNALENNGEELNGLIPKVDDNGEGRWAVKEAIDYSVPFDVNARAVFARFNSRDENAFSFKLLNGIRNEFGGHKLHKK
ncbi:MAG: NADP-dependent phosphogluconate dehydrogenase [Nanoarchaeota archaeon]